MELEAQFIALRGELNSALTAAVVAEEAAAASGTEAAARHAAETERLMAERDQQRVELEAAVEAHKQELEVRSGIAVILDLELCSISFCVCRAPDEFQRSAVGIPIHPFRHPLCTLNSNSRVHLK